MLTSPARVRAGGDVLNLFGLDMSYIGKLTKWYVPVDDLLGIYRVLYDGEERITREVIENCTTLLFLGRCACQLLVNLGKRKLVGNRRTSQEDNSTPLNRPSFRLTL